MSRGCREAPSASCPQSGLRSFQKRQLDSLTKYKMVRKLTAAVLGIRYILVLIRIRIHLRIQLLSSLILRMQKKISYFYLATCPQEHHLQSTNCIWHYFTPLKTFMRKREGSRSGSGPLTNGSGSASPKNMRILRIRIPNTR